MRLRFRRTLLHCHFFASAWFMCSVFPLAFDSFCLAGERLKVSKRCRMGSGLYPGTPIVPFGLSLTGV